VPFHCAAGVQPVLGAALQRVLLRRPRGSASPLTTTTCPPGAGAPLLRARAALAGPGPRPCGRHPLQGKEEGGGGNNGWCALEEGGGIMDGCALGCKLVLVLSRGQEHFVVIHCKVGRGSWACLGCATDGVPWDGRGEGAIMDGVPWEATGFVGVVLGRLILLVVVTSGGPACGVPVPQPCRLELAGCAPRPGKGRTGLSGRAAASWPRGCRRTRLSRSTPSSALWTSAGDVGTRSYHVGYWISV